MNPELVSEAESLWKRSENAEKFNGQFNIYPVNEGGRLVTDFQRLSEQVPETSPQNKEDVHNNELRRRLSGEAVRLDHALGGHYYTLDDMVSLYGIDREDMEGMRDWLQSNRDDVLATVDRLYQSSEFGSYRLSVPGDIPTFRRQAEEFSLTHIGAYQKKLAKLFEGLTPTGSFLRDITAVPTTNGRSYFNPLTNMLALDIGAICYTTEDQSLYVNERELIRLFGHEGMGHGINKVVTDGSDLPPFLKRGTETTRATVESVAQHYEEIIFEDLAGSPETQRDLGIEHKFPRIYQDQLDTQLIEQYKRRLFQYAITVLADKKHGDMSDPATRRDAISNRISEISDVALYPGYAVNIVENTKDSFDSQGNLSLDLVRELVYLARPAQRIVEEMREKGIKYEGSSRGQIDMLLLSGFWTPIGLVENSRVAV